MVLNALMDLAGCKAQIETAMKENFRTAESLCAIEIAQGESGDYGHVHDEPSIKGDRCGEHGHERHDKMGNAEAIDGHHGHGGCNAGHGGDNYGGHHDDHNNYDHHHCAHASCGADGNKHFHNHSDGHSHGHDHSPNHEHGHGRSYQEVVALIERSGFSSQAKKTARNIYGHIAEAEAKVHGATLKTVHFHEVGRDEAVKNALGIGMALEAIAPDIIYTSSICDGKGTVVCSHGEIPVPVPAVMALREKCSYAFQQADINMEMVTPSGLASLMGIGAVPDECGRIDVLQKAIGYLNAEHLTEADILSKISVPSQTTIGSDASNSFETASSSEAQAFPETAALSAEGGFASEAGIASESASGYRMIAFAEAKGSRDTKRPGLRVYLIETESDLFDAPTAHNVTGSATDLSYESCVFFGSSANRNGGAGEVSDISDGAGSLVGFVSGDGSFGNGSECESIGVTNSTGAPTVPKTSSFAALHSVHEEDVH